MTRLDGPDLSHYQSDVAPIDWDVMRGAGVWWVATKATQSITAVDPSLKLHRPQMRSHGFTHLLYYHWLSHTTPVAQQADHYLKTVGRLDLGEGVMLDAEEGGITEAMCVEWCDRVEQSTQKPCAIYTGAFVAGGTIWQSTRLFADRPRHLAAYASELKAKALPGVKQFPWQAWQYSSDGPVPGVTGRCDMNRIDDIGAFDRVCGIRLPPPLDKPPTKPPTTPTLPVQETEPMKVVSNAQDRVAPVDGQTYGAGKFVYIAQPDGTLRYVTGFEGRLYDGEPRVLFQNVELDEWLARSEANKTIARPAPKYIAPSYTITVPPLIMTPEA